MFIIIFFINLIPFFSIFINTIFLEKKKVFQYKVIYIIIITIIIKV